MVVAKAVAAVLQAFSPLLRALLALPPVVCMERVYSRSLLFSCQGHDRPHWRGRTDLPSSRR